MYFIDFIVKVFYELKSIVFWVFFFDWVMVFGRVVIEYMRLGVIDLRIVFSLLGLYIDIYNIVYYGFLFVICSCFFYYFFYYLGYE